MVFDKEKYPNCYEGDKYAKQVISGKIPACIYVRGACERYIKDVDNKQADFYFDVEAAERYLRLVQKFHHVIGTWASKYILYDPWQKWVWMNIMGFKLKDRDTRRYRVAHVEVPRGSGKSAMASQCALYMLALDEPNGNQISTVATKRDQARIVLDSARAMAKKNPSFLKRTGVKVLAHTITHEQSNSLFRAQSSDQTGMDGLNDILAVMDELHAMKRDVFDVVTSGMSKRRDSLTLCITTAGKDIHSVGFSQSAYAKKICTGEVSDEQMFAVVYTLDKGDDWTDETVWKKANPALGSSVDPVTFKAKVNKAIVTPADVAGVKVKHFNLWTSEADAFFDPELWDKCADPSLKLEDFKKESCRLGLDLASHIDLASIGIIFKRDEMYYLFDKTFIPEDTLEKAKNSLYDDSVARGFLIATPGAAINYEKIQAEVIALRNEFSVTECMYDPWNATETAQKLSDKVEMVKMAMNVANFSEPMKLLDGLIRKGMLRHNGSPLLRWCLSNVVAKKDHNDNVFPRKNHEKLKIDIVVALLMAMAGWVSEENPNSIYEERGIRKL